MIDNYLCDGAVQVTVDHRLQQIRILRKNEMIEFLEIQAKIEGGK